MGILPRILAVAIILATGDHDNNCFFMRLTLAVAIADGDHHEQHQRLWSDSVIWPVPHTEVYEQMQYGENQNVSILRALFYNDWKFVYNNSVPITGEDDDHVDDNKRNKNMIDHDHDDDDDVNPEKWSIIMTAARERFGYFLNQSIPPHNLKEKDVVIDRRLSGSGDGMKYDSLLIPFEGIRFHISNLSETTLYYGMDESYEIQISNPSSISSASVRLDEDHQGADTTGIQNSSNYIEISSTNVFGAIYGLETLKQLLLFFGYIEDTSIPVYVLRNDIYKLYISDTPTYNYRGIMIDTARHYLPLEIIKENLCLMNMNKLNVLHWHMSDTQSFPYASEKFPELAKYGAYCYPECIYNTTDIQMIINTATLLGIHVIIEIDLPTHSRAIGNSHPEFLSRCSNGMLTDPLNVTNDALYDFVYDLYDEITHLFTDEYVHLGGDEVSLDCWENSIMIQKWMQSHNMTKTVEVLQYFEMNLLYHVLNVTGKRPIVWQDLFDMDLEDIPRSVIFDVWKEWIMEESVYSTTAANYDILFSACWYLDHLNENWWSFYTCNPRNMPNLTSTQQGHILGGHTSMWVESVDSTNFFERVWPRSSATAEVLWSGSPTSISTGLFDRVHVRLERFRCYMLQQFIVPISPIAPGHCQEHGPFLISTVRTNDVIYSSEFNYHSVLRSLGN